ncbi:MAG: hypothetical protein ACOCZL_02205 [Bacteroidota bacterium]
MDLNINALGLFYLISLALVITLFFTHILRIKGPWGSFWTFFLIILLAVVTGEAWVEPMGPYYKDVYWLPPLAVGLVIALLLASTTPSPKTRSRIAEKRKESDKKSSALALGTFFWFLLIFMLVLVVLGFFTNPHIV